MSFHTKQWIFLLLCDGGVILAGAGAGLYQAQFVDLPLCFFLCLAGGAMLIASIVFLHRRMRCSFCHRIYPLTGWHGMECCPYCGEYFD